MIFILTSKLIQMEGGMFSLPVLKLSLEMSGLFFCDTFFLHFDIVGLFGCIVVFITVVVFIITSKLIQMEGGMFSLPELKLSLEFKPSLGVTSISH